MNSPSNLKEFLENHQVDYKDPYNFIYYNGNLKDFIPVTTDLQKVYDLYIKHYNKTIIKDYNIKFNQITSIPIYPNLKELCCNDCRLSKIPPFPNLEKLRCDGNQLTQISPMPLLKELLCDDNKLTEIPMYPKLKVLTCRRNSQLKTISPMANLEFLDCRDNILLNTLPDYPNMEKLHCDDMVDNEDYR